MCTLLNVITKYVYTAREKVFEKMQKSHANHPMKKRATVFSVCTLAAWYLATKDARWVRWSPCSLGPSLRRPTASCSLAAVRRGDCVRASWLYSWCNASIATRTRTRTFVCTSYCCSTGSAQLDFYLIKNLSHFFIWQSDGSSRRILGQNLTTWAIGLSNQILSRRIINTSYQKLPLSALGTTQILQNRTAEAGQKFFQIAK